MERKATSVSSTLGNLFPTKLSAFIFAAYVTLFVNQGILVTATKTANNKYAYNTIAAVLCTELIKLVLSAGIYLRDEPFHKLVVEITSNAKVFLLYFIPATLYCFYNNLAFVNLASYDPTTYYLLLQFRVVVTGVIFQFLFKKQLSAWQWLSLLLLTFGCVVKYFGRIFGPATGVHMSFINVHLLLILVQIFCSCFAGVYNEYLLKDSGGKGEKVHMMVQNIFMYADSIICNLIVLGLSGLSHSSNDPSSQGISFFSGLFQPSVIMVMVNNALAGIVTSIFLKNFNSILKTFAAAIELAFTAIICLFLFSIPIDIYTAISIGIVSYATYLYAKHPVIAKPIMAEHVTYRPLASLGESDQKKVANEIESV